VNKQRQTVLYLHISYFSPSICQTGS